MQSLSSTEHLKEPISP